MTEEENTQGVEEVALPSDSDEQQDVRQEETPEVSQDRVMDDQERNWREARRKMQEMERRAQDQEERIKQLQGQGQKPPEVDELANLADDDIVTAKQARSLAQKMAKQVAEETIRQREASTVEERVKSRFSDYDDVVTMENIETLKQEDPELAQSLYALAQDPYAQAVAAYKMLKKTGIGNMAKTQPQKAKAIENSKKPVSVQSVTKSSAIGNVHNFENGITPELKDQLYKEMREAIKHG
jgi:hypothetical protein